MNFKVEPLFDRVVVERAEAHQTSSGESGVAVVIPDAAQEKPQEGFIIAIGDSLKSKLKVNDHVLFGKYAGLEIEVRNKTLVILREDEILGRLQTVTPTKKKATRKRKTSRLNEKSQTRKM